MKSIHEIFLGVSPILIIILILSCCIFSCQVSYTDHKGSVIKVFMHEPGLYSVMQDDFSVVSFRDMRRNDSKLIADVQKGQPMWWEAKKAHQRGGNCGWSQVRIHIHGPEDINGGDWQQGAGGAKRQVGTKVIE